MAGGHLDRLDERWSPELPTVLVGSTAEIAERLGGLRARTGISYISVHEPALEEFAPIIPLLRAADA